LDRTIATSNQLSFDRFLAQYAEDGRYELVDGEIVRILATRQHEDVADLIEDVIRDEVNQHNLNYKVSNQIVLATQKEGKEQGRNPDVSVVDRSVWRSNRMAYAALREPIQLAMEVVSTNWEDDYIDKLEEYQRLGITEYWIVDYLAIGSRTYLGNPKVPTIFVYLLNEAGQYQVSSFRADNQIISRTFPELALTMDQILQA
jgi:Uma2 family endonuclease